MPKYEIREVRQVSYTVDVPDGSGVTPDDIAAAKLDSRNFQARGSGEQTISDASVLVEYSVHACDDDEPADVQLDAQLKDHWPPGRRRPAPMRG